MFLSTVLVNDFADQSDIPTHKFRLRPLNLNPKFTSPIPSIYALHINLELMTGTRTGVILLILKKRKMLLGRKTRNLMLIGHERSGVHKRLLLTAGTTVVLVLCRCARVVLPHSPTTATTEYPIRDNSSFHQLNNAEDICLFATPLPETGVFRTPGAPVVYQLR